MRSIFETKRRAFQGALFHGESLMSGTVNTEEHFCFNLINADKTPKTTKFHAHNLKVSIKLILG